MAKLAYKNGIASVVLRVKVLDSTSTVGAGKTGLAYNTAGLVVSTIADNEASSVVYRQADNNIETVATLGAFAAPDAGKCRFREVDAVIIAARTCSMWTFSLGEPSSEPNSWMVASMFCVDHICPGATGRAMKSSMPLPRYILKKMDLRRRHLKKMPTSGCGGREGG